MPSSRDPDIKARASDKDRCPALSMDIGDRRSARAAQSAAEQGRAPSWKPYRRCSAARQSAVGPALRIGNSR